MKNIWDEEAIRKEMERLDALTGLSGAKLPIKLTDGEHVIGCYHGDKDGRFTFSKKYFFDPDWAEEEALDTIRHEYGTYAIWDRGPWHNLEDVLRESGG